MNRTTEDSKKAMAVLLGGDTIVLEDGKLEMPPEQAKNTKTVVNNIEEGNYIVIALTDCKLQDMNFSKEQKTQLIENRKARKTAKALARTANQR